MGGNNTVSSVNGNYSQKRLEGMFQNNHTIASRSNLYPVSDTSFSMRDIAFMLDRYELGPVDLLQLKTAVGVYDKEEPSWEKSGKLVIHFRDEEGMKSLLRKLTEGENKCTNLFPDERGQANCEKTVEKVKELAGMAPKEEDEDGGVTVSYVLEHVFDCLKLFLIFCVLNRWWNKSRDAKDAAKKAKKNNKKGPPNNPTGGSRLIEPVTLPRKLPDHSSKAVRLDPVAEGMRAFAKRYGTEGVKSFAPSPSKVSNSLPPMQRLVFVESDKGKVANRGGSLVFDHKKVDVLTPTAIFSGILAGIYYTLRQYARALVLVPK